MYRPRTAATAASAIEETRSGRLTPLVATASPATKAPAVTTAAGIAYRRGPHAPTVYRAIKVATFVSWNAITEASSSTARTPTGHRRRHHSACVAATETAATSVWPTWPPTAPTTATIVRGSEMHVQPISTPIAMAREPISEHNPTAVTSVTPVASTTQPSVCRRRPTAGTGRRPASATDATAATAHAATTIGTNSSSAPG